MSAGNKWMMIFVVEINCGSQISSTIVILFSCSWNLLVNFCFLAMIDRSWYLQMLWGKFKEFIPQQHWRWCQCCLSPPRLDLIHPLCDMWASDADWLFNSERFWYVLIYYYYYYHHFPGQTFCKLFYSERLGLL